MPILQRDLLDQLRTESLALHARIATVARTLDPEQLVRRSTPSSWSVGEVLEHLCTADELYAKPLATLIHRAHRDAGAPMRAWTPTWLGNFLCRTLAKPRPMKAPRAFRPGPTPRGGVVEDFLTRDSRILHRMEESSSLDWNELRMTPPTLPFFLKLNLGDVFQVHVVHVRRHLAQMERVAAAVTR